MRDLVRRFLRLVTADNFSYIDLWWIAFMVLAMNDKQWFAAAVIAIIGSFVSGLLTGYANRTPHHTTERRAQES